MKKLIFILYFTSSILIKSAFGQNNPTVPDPHVVGPMPNAASLGKYGDVPIGLYTGTLQYDLPLYTYKTKHLSVPISLNYSTNGVKVDQEDSKVGVDWALTCGGVITRTVYGRGRVFGGGVPATAPTTDPEEYYQSVPGHDPTGLLNWLGLYVQQDTQLDEFNFNFGGYSGKFVLLNNNGAFTVTQIQYSNLKIECNYSSSVGNSWYFRITTPDGVAYYFGENQATETSDNFVSASGLITQGDNYPAPQLSAFYLTRIVHPYDPTDVITFHYSTHPDTYISSLTAFTIFLQSTCPCVQSYNSCVSCAASACVYGPVARWSGGEESYGINTSQGPSLKLDSISSPNYGG